MGALSIGKLHKLSTQNLCIVHTTRKSARQVRARAAQKRKVACGKGATARLFAMKTIMFINEVVWGVSFELTQAVYTATLSDTISHNREALTYRVVKGGSRTHFDTIQLLALIPFECRPSWRTLESFHRVSKKPSLTLITYILYHTLWGLSIVFLNFFYFFYGGRIIHPRPHSAFSYER